MIILRCIPLRIRIPYFFLFLLDLANFCAILSWTLFSFFSSDLRTVDTSSTLSVEFVSSILDYFGTVVVLDRVRDAISGMIVLASSLHTIFCCLLLSRVRDEIGSLIG